MLAGATSVMTDIARARARGALLASPMPLMVAGMDVVERRRARRLAPSIRPAGPAVRAPSRPGIALPNAGRRRGKGERSHGSARRASGETCCPLAGSARACRWPQPSTARFRARGTCARTEHVAHWLARCCSPPRKNVESEQPLQGMRHGEPPAAARGAARHEALAARAAASRKKDRPSGSLEPAALWIRRTAAACPSSTSGPGGQVAAPGRCTMMSAAELRR
jgi:hypothetical protein